MIDDDLKKLIESEPLALATIMPDGKPNVIGIAYVKVVKGNQLLISDNYMNQTVKDIKTNPNVALIVWDKEMNGYKLIGEAVYFSEGQWLDKAKSLSENKGILTKGAILVNLNKIIKSA
ncbi:MAG: pyridoxamine 5'-phosphate oxidase family protein [Candidatus Roizmanbacteria bacterium]|nr:MAG: pyridoxamine 5'-phosphate oxidase family protein [Candidatus Roizmanbacteria bacterium]